MNTQATRSLPNSRRLRGLLAISLAAVSVACGSTDSTEVSAPTTTVEAAATTDETNADDATTASATDASGTADAPAPTGSDGDAPAASPPGVGGADAPPGPPTGDGTGDSNSLTDGPQSPGEHGPLSAADTNRDETVTRDEIEAFMDAGPERRIGLVAFFDENDPNGDDVIDEDELADVTPEFAFDGTDANADGQVSRAEVEDYVNEPGRLYRAIGLGEFFDLVDTNDDDEISPAETEAAHESGQLERG
ncbi:MAG: hypothetical protein R2754_10845 [Microthrixaceae bacterium]